MASDQPNIVFINVDQWRGDCLGCDGHPIVETPHLDRMFEDGVSFTRAYAAVPSCIAARASIMTGQKPCTHGRTGYKDHVPWNYEVTLPGLLAGAGYHTQAVGKMHVSPARNLLGFHNVVLHDGYLHCERKKDRDYALADDYLPWLRQQHGPAADYIDTGIGCNGYAVRPWVYDDMLHPTAWVTTQSIDFLRRRDPRRPFFLFASYHRPHPPLDPPRDYLAMYENKPLSDLPMGDWLDQIPGSNRGIDSPVPRDSWQIDRARRAYYAQLTFVDHQLNRLTHALSEHGCLDNTVFLFCADHGDMLYDHERVAKGLPYEGSTRIPFIMRLPRSWQGVRGQRVDAPVELQDVLPTLCDAAGIDVPDTIEGRSVLPFCRGETPDWREAVHGEHSMGASSNHWIVDRRWKYTWYSQSGVEQLFDLGEDPQECRNLSDVEPERLETMRSRLIAELADREEGYVQDGKLVVGCTPKAVLDCCP